MTLSITLRTNSTNNTLNVKLSNSRLNELKSGIKMVLK